MLPLILALVAVGLLMIAVISTYRRGSQAPLVAAVTDSNEQVKKYTSEQVALHDKPGDLWLIIDGKVYDFSEFHETHPGGDAIFNNAGRDSSIGFHGDQHPSKVYEMLDEFFVGELVDDDSTAESATNAGQQLPTEVAETEKKRA